MRGGPFPRFSEQEDLPCPEKLKIANQKIRKLKQQVIARDTKIAALTAQNQLLRDRLSEASRGFNAALKAFVTVYLSLHACKYYLQVFMDRFGELEEELSGYLAVTAILKPWKDRLAFLPDDLSKEVVLRIEPQDFGYSSWEDKTPDSGWTETYFVRSHLMNEGAIQPSGQAPFPSFLWNFDGDVPDWRGLAEWLYSGSASNFPTGRLAVQGHKEWSRRITLVIDSLLEFVGVFRQVAWPEVPTAGLARMISCEPRSTDDEDGLVTGAAASSVGSPSVRESPGGGLH